MADYITSTQGQLDALGQPLNHNILQSVQNAAVQASGYTSPGAYEQFGSTGVTGSTSGSYDPYSQWGGQTAYNNLLSGFRTQKDNIKGSANEAVANAGVGLRGGILSFIDSLKSSQRGIENKAVQNEMRKTQGQRDTSAMVGRGIRSGSSILANKNALDSSAAGAIANAYGDIGRRQLSQVGNEYALGQNEIGMAQEDLEMQRAAGVRGINDSKTQVVNNIVSDARNQLAALDGQIANASISERINIEQEKEAIRQQALSQLQQYDTLLNEGVAGVRAGSMDERRSKAAELASAGQAPANAFQFEDAPAQFQNTGFGGNLPLFTLNRRREG